MVHGWAVQTDTVSREAEAVGCTCWSCTWTYMELKNKLSLWITLMSKSSLEGKIFDPLDFHISLAGWKIMILKFSCFLPPKCLDTCLNNKTFGHKYLIYSCFKCIKYIYIFKVSLIWNKFTSSLIFQLFSSKLKNL